MLTSEVGSFWYIEYAVMFWGNVIFFVLTVNVWNRNWYPSLRVNNFVAAFLCLQWFCNQMFSLFYRLFFFLLPFPAYSWSLFEDFKHSELITNESPTKCLLCNKPGWFSGESRIHSHDESQGGAHGRWDSRDHQRGGGSMPWVHTVGPCVALIYHFYRPILIQMELKNFTYCCCVLNGLLHHI